MAQQQLNADTCAQSRNPSSSGGLQHVFHRHHDNFTVVGNHLAQHRELSGLAMGIGLHIQSLPAGARVSIKALVQRFREGEVRIAAVLRELEAHGYLVRKRERLPSGRFVTRTVWYHNPSAVEESASPEVQSASSAEPSVSPQEHSASPAEHSTKPPATPKRQRAAATTDEHVPSPTPSSNPTATALLCDLRRQDPRLLLSGRDVLRLAPAVTAWLDRGIEPEAVRRTLVADLPAEPLRRPAALLAYRLTEWLPPPLPAAPAAAPRPDPLQNCDSCDRAFRAPKPGQCRSCQSQASPRAVPLLAS